ncbi:integrase core domain protein [Trichuris suis]|nr:integrase core domain protein [Trichuris suis]
MDEHNYKRPICETFFKVKVTAFPFLKSETRANRLMELIHSDLCGPMPVETPSGCCYFLTLIYDHSRFTVIRLLNSKDEVFDAVKNYIAKTSNHFSRKPMIFRSHNRREYVTKSLETYFKLQGIEHQLTIPYTSQQNDVAERRNRSFTETVRCMLSDAQLQSRFWGEAVLTAAYLQSSCPAEVHQGHL